MSLMHSFEPLKTYLLYYYGSMTKLDVFLNATGITNKYINSNAS